MGGKMKPKNSRKEWTKTDVNQLKQFAKQNVDTDDIARKLGRTPAAVYNKASEKEISLKPKDK